jgi:hypothetical protein
MPDVEEVFRMATQKVKPDPGALERQFQGQRRRARNRRIGGFVAAAVILVGAAVLGAVLLNGGNSAAPVPIGSSNPAPTATAPTAGPKAAFPIRRVVSLWIERGGTLLLSIRSDGTYVIGAGDAIVSNPADIGTVTVAGDTLRFASDGAGACAAGQGWSFDPLRLHEDNGAFVRMTSTTSNATCSAAPASAATWVNAAYWPTGSYAGKPPKEGSGTPVTAADETGIFIVDDNGIVVLQQADGTFRTYSGGNLESAPDESGTWAVPSPGKLVWTFDDVSPYLGCPGGRTTVTHDEVVSPGVILDTTNGGICHLGGGGRHVLIRI